MSLLMQGIGFSRPPAILWSISMELAWFDILGMTAN
jgi:hypothetical protein